MCEGIYGSLCWLLWPGGLKGTTGPSLYGREGRCLDVPAKLCSGMPKVWGRILGSRDGAISGDVSGVITGSSGVHRFGSSGSGGTIGSGWRLSYRLAWGRANAVESNNVDAITSRMRCIADEQTTCVWVMRENSLSLKWWVLSFRSV